jgi:HK97 gp10 family phage protein
MWKRESKGVMPLAYSIKGLDALIRKLASMGGNVMEALGIAVAQTTEVAKSDAQANVPVDTGMLRQSLAHGTDVEYGESRVTGTVGTSAYYAVYVEMGTVNMPAHPYMLPAANANKDTFRRISENELRKAIDRTAGGR